MPGQAMPQQRPQAPPCYNEFQPLKAEAEKRGLAIKAATEGRKEKASREEVCALLDKTVRRIVPTPVRFAGFEIEDDFVLGYGLDFAQCYRNLDHVIAGDLSALRDDPSAHVSTLYGR